MTGPHEPTPEFRAFLETEITRQLRRELRAPDTGRRRHIRTTAIAVVALAIGMLAGALPAQVQQNRQREALLLMIQAETQVAAGRLQAARTALEEAERKHQVGVVGSAALAAAGAELRAAQARLGVARLKQEEIRASAAPANDALAAPLVNGRDFMSERLGLELEAARARFEPTRDSVAELERRARLGLLGQLPLAESQLNLARREAELRLLAAKLELRQDYLDKALTAAEAERRLQQLEVAQQVNEITARHTLAEQRLRRLEELRAAGLTEELDVKRAEVELLERAAELKAAQQRMQELSAARSR